MLRRSRARFLGGVLGQAAAARVIHDSTAERQTMIQRERKRRERKRGREGRREGKERESEIGEEKKR